MSRVVDERFKTDLLPAIREDVLTNIRRELLNSNREGLRLELCGIAEDQYRQMKQAQDDIPSLGSSQHAPSDDVSDRPAFSRNTNPDNDVSPSDDSISSN